MPLPFSIFSNYRAGIADQSAKSGPEDAVGVVQEWLEATVAKEAAQHALTGVLPPLVAANGDSLGHTFIHTPAESGMGDSLLFRETPLRMTPASLQPDNEPTPIPTVSPNQRFAAFGAPTVAAAASLALVISQPQEDRLMPKDPEPASAAVVSNESWSPNQISNHELAQLRVDVRQEIDQVKNDLFGAAMGVSALKDRLDGLETQVITQAMQAAEAQSATPAAGPTRDEVQAWVQEWLQAHLEEAVQASVQKALSMLAEQATSTLSGNELFRMPVSPQGHEPVPLFSQAPLILSSRPS